MERLGWRSPRAFMLAAISKTGHGWPVCSQSSIIPCAYTARKNIIILLLNMKYIMGYENDICQSRELLCRRARAPYSTGKECG